MARMLEGARPVLKPVEEFKNQVLVCVDCGEEFAYTASAAKYFFDRGFLDPPKRCKHCYQIFNASTAVDSDSAA